MIRDPYSGLSNPLQVASPDCANRYSTSFEPANGFCCGRIDKSWLLSMKRKREKARKQWLNIESPGSGVKCPLYKQIICREGWRSWRVLSAKFSGCRIWHLWVTSVSNVLLSDEISARKLNSLPLIERCGGKVLLCELKNFSCELQMSSALNFVPLNSHTTPRWERFSPSQIITTRSKWRRRECKFCVNPRWPKSYASTNSPCLPLFALIFS